LDINRELRTCTYGRFKPRSNGFKPRSNGFKSRSNGLGKLL